MSSQPFVVVGAGQAGLQVCASLRKEGYDGELVLVGEESTLPYQRPPLSKSFLEAEVEAERLLFRPQSFFEKQNITVRLGRQVSKLDRDGQRLLLDDGSELAYSRLALTTGTRVRPLSCAGHDAATIHYIRTLDDSLRLRPLLTANRRMAVVGGGFIGLEVAAVAMQLGLQVTLIETQDRLMARAVSPVISEHYAAMHRSRGVDVRLNCGLESIATKGQDTVLNLSDGSKLEVDLLVAGIGVLPNVELAADAGLECRNGIVVDGYARTNDGNIVSAGDCTMHYNGFLDRELRLESVQNAVDQAKVAAATMCGVLREYHQVPWFWSDQYEHKLQMAGIGMPYDALAARGTPDDDGFSVFYYRDNRLVGADSVNRPAEHMAVRKLLAAGASVTPPQASDLDLDIMQLARELSAPSS